MEESEESSTTKVGLLSLPPIKSKLAEQFGVMTPPHHSASVPFRWEEEPGKPRPSSCLSLTTTPFKGLDLPPRLMHFDSKFTKTPSPTTVLEGPYVARSIFHSFRLTRNRHVSFDGGESGASSPDRPSLGLSRRWLLLHRNPKQGKKEVVDEGSFVFSGDATRITTTKKRRRLLGLTKARSNFWATVYGAVKQVIPTPRRSK